MSPVGIALAILAAAPLGDGADLTIPGDAPAVVRMHIQVGGRPFAAAWEAYLGRLFADLDRDGDGKLDRSEAARVPAAGFLRLLLQGDTETETAVTVAPLNALDANGDNGVTPGELAAYYRREELGALAPLIRSAGSDPVNDALFHILDADRDGQLSAAELGRATAVLHRRDVNEDEWLLPAEIAPPRPGPVRTAEAGPPSVHVHAATDKAADRELTIQLGGAKSTITGVNPLTLGRIIMTVEASDRPENAFASVRQFYLQEFQAVDAEGRGQVAKEMLGDTDFLRGIFALADRDADGKLSSRELASFLDLHREGAAALVTVAVVDQSRGLFEHLDANADGRLSLRELGAAWARLRSFDRDGNGRLARAELPHHFVVRVTQGYARPRRMDAGRTGPAPAVRRGPAWFQALDRNGDGDVSPREFLGTEAAFRRLDLDGDGLIDAAEAEKAPVAPN